MIAHTPKHLLSVLAGLLLVACDASAQDKPGLPTESVGPAIPVPAKTPPPPTKGQGTTTATRDITKERYVGAALPKHEAELGPRMSGTLAAVFVEEGERVKKGQVLFKLDARSIQLGVAQSETALQGAVIARDNAKKELERQQQLAAKGTVSSAVLERAESAFNSAANAVAQAEVGLSMSRRGAADSSVISPIDGVVAHKYKDRGETVTMMPPTIVVVIQDQSVLEIRTRVPESALRLIKEGERVTAHFSAVEVTREAKIVRIQPTVDPNTRTVEIVADVDNSDNVLRPGMYVELELRPPPAPLPPPPAAEDKSPVATAAPAKQAAKKGTKTTPAPEATAGAQ